MKTNKKSIVVFLSLVFLIFNTLISNAQIDSSAVAILDRMSYALGSLKSCSFTLKTESDLLDDRLGLITNFNVAQINLRGPDKFFISKSGDFGNKEFFYNGKDFAYNSKDNKLYAIAPAPPTIIETFDSISNTLGIDIPSADFFYPYFTDDLLEISDNLQYLGITKNLDKSYHHIAGTTDSITYQIWISNDSSFLPVKFTIVYSKKASSPQYTAVYSDWVLNPELPDSMFEFIVPSGSLKVKFSDKK